MNSKKDIAVLISGRGSNLEALLNSQHNFNVVAVISDKDDAAGIKTAKKFNVPLIECFPRSNFNSKQDQKNSIYNKLRTIRPDLICLAGFMQIIEASFINEFYGRIINIHPSLLPEFPGLDTHKRAIEAKKSRHGCSVHFVDSGLDTGAIIAQASCLISSDESSETLSEKVLKLEHKLYPWVVNNIAAGNISLDANNKIKVNASIGKEADILGFII